MAKKDLYSDSMSAKVPFLLSPVKISNELTYVGIFLTLSCNYKCSYCINRYGDLAYRTKMSSKDWISGLNRFELPREWKVPLTLQGGEPSVHRGFIDIIKGLNPNFYMDLLTNLSFDIDHFMGEIPPERFKRDVPYPSIRVSYHPEFSPLKELVSKISKMTKKGYSIGLYAVEHPAFDLTEISAISKDLGIDFRLKEFLGEYKSTLYGNYRYPGAIKGGGIENRFLQNHRSADCSQR